MSLRAAEVGTITDFVRDGFGFVVVVDVVVVVESEEEIKVVSLE